MSGTWELLITGVGERGEVQAGKARKSHGKVVNGGETSRDLDGSAGASNCRSRIRTVVQICE
jgi:hypothetical protein